MLLKGEENRAKMADENEKSKNGGRNERRGGGGISDRWRMHRKSLDTCQPLHPLCHNACARVAYCFIKGGKRGRWERRGGRGRETKGRTRLNAVRVKGREGVASPLPPPHTHTKRQGEIDTARRKSLWLPQTLGLVGVRAPLWGREGNGWWRRGGRGIKGKNNDYPENDKMVTKKKMLRGEWRRMRW